MTKEEIIEMARQAGFLDYELDDGTTDACDKRYEAFARLVAEHERDAFTAHAMTSAEKAIDVAIKLEREACAKMCDSFQARDVGMQPAECAGAIRRRGQA